MAEQRLPTVSAVMVVRDPDPKHMAWSLSRLPEQNYPVEEVIVVDSSEEPVEAEVEEIPTRVIHAPDMGIGDARQKGIQVASGDFILEMDEDAVLVRDDYIASAILRGSQSGSAAAGGVVLPIRGNLEGHGIALLDRLNPTTLGTHNMVFPRRLCVEDGTDQCYLLPNRGEDRTLRKHLAHHGRIERMHDQAVLKDLPTTRQETARNLLSTIVVGAVAGTVSSIVTAYVGKQLRDAGVDLPSR